MNYLDDLKQYTRAFKELAKFTEADQINVSSDGKIEKKPIYTCYFDFFAVFVNAFIGQDSNAAIKGIQDLFNNTTSFLNQPSGDTLNIFKRLKRLCSLKNSAIRAANNTLLLFKETCELGKAGAISPTQPKKEEWGGQVKTLREKLLDKLIPSVQKHIDEIHAFLEPGKLSLEDITYLFTGDAPSNCRLIFQSFFSAYHIKTTLTSLFGARIVNDVFAFYKLESKGVLSSSDIQALCIGIKANFTYDDILFLVKDGTFLNPKVFEKLYPISLEEEKVLQILEELRKNRDLSTLRPCYEAQAKKDIQFLKTCDIHKLYLWHDDYDLPLQKHQHYSEHEYIAKDIIYGLYSETDADVKFSKGVLFPCYTMNKGDEGKKLSCLQAWPLPGGEGFYPALILPMTPQDKVNAKIVFRGTADTDSKWRDVNPLEKRSSAIEGPGICSFYNKLPTLLEGIKASFCELNCSKIDLETLGHSLGASDAARFLVNFLKNKVVDIASFKLFAFNTPAISEEECMEFSKLSAAMSHLPIDCTYFEFEKDPCQGGGAMLPGYYSADNVDVTVIHMDRINKFNQDGCVQLVNFHGCGVAIDYTIKDVCSKHGHRCFTEKDDSEPNKKNPTKLVGIYTKNEPEKLQNHLITSAGRAAKEACEAGIGIFNFYTKPSPS